MLRVVTQGSRLREQKTSILNIINHGATGKDRILQDAALNAAMCSKRWHSSLSLTTHWPYPSTRVSNVQFYIVTGRQRPGQFWLALLMTTPEF